MDRYKCECKKISEQIEPSEEFMKNLKSNLNKKIAEEKIKRKQFLSKVAVFFITVTLVSSGAFAKDIGNWFSQFFANTDESMQIAVENGYVQNVEMDYVEKQGIAIKVNSLMIDDNKMNIVFDVKGEIDGELFIKDLYFLTNDQKYDNTSLNMLSSSYNREFKSLSKNEHLLSIKISNIEQKLKCAEELNVVISGIYIMGIDNEEKEINEIWECNVFVDEDNFKKSEVLACQYIIEENDYVEDYEIYLTNTGVNIKLVFNKEFESCSLLDKKNIYIEIEDGEKIKSREFSRIKNNIINLNLPVTEDKIGNNFKIVLNIQNEKIVLNAKKQNS